MTDLQSRRALITGVDSVGHYRQIKAHIPVKEMYGYASTLRSITQGKAKFHRHFMGYQAMTKEVQDDLLKRLKE